MVERFQLRKTLQARD